MSADDEDELPEAVREAEREGPERPLVTGNPLAKAGIALLATLLVGLAILATVLIMSRV